MNGHAGYIPSGLIVYLFVSSMLAKARSSKVKRSGAVMIFDATLPTKVLSILCTTGFSIGSIYLLETTPAAALGVWVFAVLAVIGTVAFPSTISITKDGVQEHQWWGKSIAIDWKDIHRIEYRKGPATTILFGPDGKKIAHSGFHRDPKTFQSECVAHTHLKLVTRSL